MRTLAASICAFAVLFLPDVAGAATGSLVYSDGNGAVYTASLQGTGAATIFTPDSSTLLQALAVSPDGRQVLAYDAGDTEQLVLVPIGGGTPVPVAGSTGADAGAFSPDGTQIVFSINDSTSSPLAPGVWTVPVAGGTPKLVAATPGDDFDDLPRFSPDGTKIAFARDSIDAAGHEVVTLELVAASGGTPTPITTGLAPDPSDGGQISFSPDGSTIAYAGDFDDPGIYVVPAAGGTPTQLTTDLDEWPVYSADGSTILFSRDASSQNAVATQSSDVFELWSMAKDGTGAASLAQGDFENLALVPPAAAAHGAPAGTPTTTASKTAPGSAAAAATKAKSGARAVRVTIRRPRYTVRWRGTAKAWKVTLKVGRKTVTARVRGSVHSHAFVLPNAKGRVSAHVVPA
jgi:TolB protein